jgi:hypothetical protein
MLVQSKGENANSQKAFEKFRADEYSDHTGGLRKGRNLASNFIWAKRLASDNNPTANILISASRLRLSSFGEIHAVQQRLESRVGAEGIENRVHS